VSRKAFADLIAGGKLQVGTTLRHAGRQHLADQTATVVSNGIKVGHMEFSTPSAAARSITGKPVDGWMFWKLPDGRPLASLR